MSFSDPFQASTTVLLLTTVAGVYWCYILQGRNALTTVLRTVLRTVLASAVATSALVAVPARSHADSLADKQAEALRIERELETRGQELSLVTERYNQARLAADAATVTVLNAGKRLRETEAATAAAQKRFNGQIVAMYKGEHAPDPMGAVDVAKISQLSVRSKYAAVVSSQSARILDDFRALRVQQQQEQDQLQRARDEAQGAANAVASRQREAARLMSAQRILLAQVKGEVAQLVAAEQRRRQEEAERRARAELERRRTIRKPDSGSTVRTGPAPAPHPRAALAVTTAKAQLGKPYLWAADGPDSFDCSGLTMYAWAAAGVSMPHSSGAQYSRFPHVSIDELAPGDLLFYGSPIHHVGMFAGGGQMVNAPQTGETVRISSIYRNDFVGAARPG